MADLICYKLTPCTEGFPTYYVSNDLSLGIDKYVKLCPENIPTNQINFPATGVPFSLNKTESLEIFTLEDCCNPDNKISLTTYTLTPFVDSIIQIDQLPGKCWYVSKGSTVPPIGLADVITGYVYGDCDTCKGDFICTNIIPLSECYCYQIQESTDCVNVITLLNVNTLIPYDDCNYCEAGANPPCYELVDCEDPSHKITTNEDLSQYLGQVVEIESCPGYCFFVQEAENCFGYVSVLPITASYNTCTDCNPPAPVVIPSLINRRVKPGYDTPSCPPEYTEKVSCTFGEAMYEEVLSKRYGLEDCCTIDVLKWTIKKELLNLKVLEDPNFITPIKVCKCYTIEQVEQTVTYKYIDCEGCLVKITILPGNTETVCSQIYPKPDCPPDNSVYIITPSETICTNNQDCTPPPPPIDCQCYSLVITGAGALYSYTACDGTIYTDVSLAKNANICAQTGTVTATNINITALGTPCINKFDCEDFTCNCYTITPAGNFAVRVTYTDCVSRQEITTGNLVEPLIICAIEGTVSWTGDPIVTVGGECTSSEDCAPIPTCYCYRIIVQSDTGSITYLDCNGSPQGMSFSYPQILNLCATEESISTTSGEVSIIPLAPCDPNIGCFITCTCYSFILQVPDTITYYRCSDGAKQTISLNLGVHTLCAAQQPTATSPVEFVAGSTCIGDDSGNCAIPCVCYVVQNPNELPIIVSYQDCEGIDFSTSVASGQTLYICARAGTMSGPSPILITPSTICCGTSGCCPPA